MGAAHFTPTVFSVSGSEMNRPSKAVIAADSSSQLPKIPAAIHSPRAHGVGLAWCGGSTLAACVRLVGGVQIGVHQLHTLGTHAPVPHGSVPSVRDQPRSGSAGRDP